MITPTTAISTDNDKSKTTLADYLGDLVSLESHIEAALDNQKKETQTDPTAGPLVNEFHDMVRGQRDALKAIQTEKGLDRGQPDR